VVVVFRHTDPDFNYRTAKAGLPGVLPQEAMDISSDQAMFFRGHLLDDLPVDELKGAVTIRRQGKKLLKFNYCDQLRLYCHSTCIPSRRSNLSHYICLRIRKQAPRLSFGKSG